MEEWKSVKGYEGVYQVSSLGNIRRKGKISNRKLYKEKNGYLTVNLSRCGLSSTRTVHSIVAEAFLNHVRGERGLVVDHINNIKDDNRVENLQIITLRENLLKDSVSTSEYAGVYWAKDRNKWRAILTYNYNKYNLGTFGSEEEARDAYLKKLKYLERNESKKDTIKTND